jgi:hypothetical protein
MNICGSIPFKWKSKPDLKWAPKGMIKEIISKHFYDQSKLGI